MMQEIEKLTEVLKEIGDAHGISVRLQPHGQLKRYSSYRWSNKSKSAWKILLKASVKLSETQIALMENCK